MVIIYKETYKPKPNKNNNQQKHIFSIYFHYKSLNFIHINKILRNHEVKWKRQKISQNEEIPSVVYGLGSTARNK